MTIEARPKYRIYTVVPVAGETIRLCDKSPDLVDARTGHQAVLIIKGTARSIRADTRIITKKIVVVDAQRELRDKLKKGDICTIIVANRIRLWRAVFRGREQMNGRVALIFTKSRDGSDTIFWAPITPYPPLITKLNRKRTIAAGSK